MHRILFFFLSLTLFYSCIDSRKIVSFQADPATDSAVFAAWRDTPYVPIIQPGDILSIFVTSSSPEVAKYFNFSERPEDQSSMANSYIVDASGAVRLPLVGFIEVAGLTTLSAHDTLTRRLEKYLLSPTIKLNIRNFRVTVMGEVMHPGMVTTNNESISLPEAIALAGDLTVYSRRDNIMVIRQERGKKEFGTVNLESREVFASPYYHLHSGDIVYVQPLKTKKAMAETWYRIIPVIFSGISLTMSVLAFTKIAQ
jgi:polysaccharide export outer membrane protein